VRVLEVPLDRPLDSQMPKEEHDANRELDDAQALVESYGVRAVTRLVRARSAAAAIVEEARSRNAELVLLGAMRRRGLGGRPVFGHTVESVLKASPSRVLVAGRMAR
jgi:basic amino acid/polyamine antiporter, APA family